jgi:hypothetical protein
MEEIKKLKTSESLRRAIKKYRQKEAIKEKDRKSALDYYYRNREDQISKKLKIREDNKNTFLEREAIYRARTKARTELLKYLPFFHIKILE